MHDGAREEEARLVALMQAVLDQGQLKPNDVARADDILAGIISRLARVSGEDLKMLLKEYERDNEKR